MPVERVPVVHKFGIISHTQRLALEDRLTKKSQATEPPRTFSRTRRIPYEVTEDFIAKLNDSNEEDRRELEGFALKMISRAKRRAGILAGGKGDHVDLGKSWTELGLLAQCTSRVIQEEALELLITSLGHAPPAVDQLPSLLYLAKSCLHWLRKCVISPSCLRTAELKLVKMAYLTFSRIYYHNMTQDLKGYQDEKRSLLKYLSNLPDQQEEAYKSFPGILLAFRYIKEVCHLICTGCGESSQKGSSVIEPVPEGATADQEPEPAVQDRPAVEAPVVQAAEGGRLGLPLLLEEEEEEEPYQGSGDMGFNEAISLSLPHSPAAASSIHDLSPTLWHALDVWRSVMHRGTGLRQALEGLSMCGTGLTSELWLDVCCAFQVLTEVSKHDIAVLRTFQALAAGLFSRPAEMSDAHARHIHLCNNCLSSITEHHQAKGFTDDDLIFNMDKTQTASDFVSVGQTPSFVRGLRDFANLGLDDRPVKQSEAEDDAESVTSRSDASSEASFADVSSVESGHRGRSGHVNEKSASNMSKTYKKTRKTVVDKGQMSSDSEDEVEKPRKSQTQSLKQTSVPKKETESSVRARGGTAVRFNVQDTENVNTEGGVPKAQMERSLTKDSLFSAHTRSSVSIPLAEEDDKSSVRTGTSQFSDAAGLTGWRWELAYIYTDCMTSVCMNGQSSAIQKTALLGSEANRKVTVYGKRNVMSTEGLGLLDLLKIKFPVGEGKEHKDWSWRVRFAAVQGLVRICRHCSGDNTRDGMCGVAWTQLMRHHSQERDVRVLEAWKLAQIESDLDNKLPLLDIANSFPSWAAGKLSAVLLPPLPPVVPLSSRSRSRARATPLSKPTPVVKRGPKRPSLRQEILLATAAREPQPDYRSRRNQDLMLVIEDQWRKQLHEEQEQEEADRRMAEASRVEGIVVKEGRRSRQGREADGRGEEVGVERERSRSGQELMEDV